jgi:hypothetical protein
MLELIDINKILEVIPNILEYFIPGFIFLTIRNLSLAKETSKDKFIVINSIVISFIFVEILKLIPWLNNNDNFTLLSIILMLVLSKIYTKFELEDKVIGQFIKGKTTNDDVFSVFIKKEEGAWVRVYMKDVIYVGKIFHSEDRYTGGNRYIILVAFQRFTYRWKLVEDNSEDDYIKVLLNMKDISRIEKVRGT